jgi:hypothetical protein
MLSYQHQIVVMFYFHIISQKAAFACSGPFFILSGLAHFQDFRVFKFFPKTYDILKNGRSTTKTVGVLQCKSDFLDAGSKAYYFRLLLFGLYTPDKLSLSNFLFIFPSFSRHSKRLQCCHPPMQKSPQNIYMG